MRDILELLDPEARFRRLMRQYNRSAKREEKAWQYRKAALAGGGDRERTRRRIQYLNGQLRVTA